MYEGKRILISSGVPSGPERFDWQWTVITKVLADGGFIAPNKWGSRIQFDSEGQNGFFIDEVSDPCGPWRIEEGFETTQPDHPDYLKQPT